MDIMEVVENILLNKYYELHREAELLIEELPEEAHDLIREAIVALDEIAYGKALS